MTYDARDEKDVKLGGHPGRGVRKILFLKV
jgi:hypothetical protein